MYTLRGLTVGAFLVLALCPALAASETNQALLQKRSHAAEFAMKAGVVTVVQTVVCMQVPTDPPTTTDPPVPATSLAGGCDTQTTGDCGPVPVPTSLAAGCNTQESGGCPSTAAPICYTKVTGGCPPTATQQSCTELSAGCPLTAAEQGCLTQLSAGCPLTAAQQNCNTLISGGCEPTYLQQGCAPTAIVQGCSTASPQCGGATSAWRCVVTTTGANCVSVTPANCGVPPAARTSTDACAKNTFPAACKTQSAGYLTCSDVSCSYLTLAQCGSGLTSVTGCKAWTHVREGRMCATVGAYCLGATLAPACAGTVSPDCNENNTMVIRCVNTASVGFCSSAGACNTWGVACITTSPENIGMCGNYSAATGGRRCTASETPAEPTALNLVGGFAALLACFAFKKVA
jgi:hypothetical protein